MSQLFQSKVLFMVLVCSLGFGLTQGLSAEASVQKIGAVDMQFVIQNVNAGKTARTSLEAEFNKKKTELQKEESELKAAHEEFQKQSLAMNESARLKKQSELQQRIVQLQQNTQKSQMEIQKKEQELTRPIVTRIQEVIKEIASSGGYSAVLEKGGGTNVLYISEQDDLTPKVVEAYNKKFGKK